MATAATGVRAGATAGTGAAGAGRDVGVAGAATGAGAAGAATGAGATTGAGGASMQMIARLGVGGASANCGKPNKR